MNTITTSLFLRADGSLMLVRGDDAVECQLSPEQLLTLGVDCLRTAVALQPKLMEAAADALDATYVLPMSEGPCPSTIN